MAEEINFENLSSRNLDEPPIVNTPFRFMKGLRSDLRDTLEQRELLRSFILREIRQRYKGTFLGWGWALVKPLVLLMIYGIAVGLFLGAGKSIPQFAIYIYSGILLWTLFSSIVSGCINSLPDNAGLISKAKFQKELLMFAVVVVAAIDFLIQSMVLLLGYLAYRELPNPQTLVWIVPAILVTILLALALGIILAASNVYFRDIGYLTEIALQVGFWLVPIVYASSMVKSALQDNRWAEILYFLNPMIPAMNATRISLWPAAESELGASLLASDSYTHIGLAICFVGSVSLLWLAQRYFSRVAGNMAQEL